MTAYKIKELLTADSCGTADEEPAQINEPICNVVGSLIGPSASGPGRVL